MANTSAPEAGAYARSTYQGPANLNGKVAIVTGGSQGLGEAIARLFGERGAAGLVICGRNAKGGERVASEISATGCPTVFVQADLAKVADCRKVVAKADQHFGRIDALVNAAGLSDRGDIFDTTEERFNEIFNVNVRAPFFLIQESVRIMRRQKDRGFDRQHSVDVGPRRPALYYGLLRVERRARHTDQECRPFAAQIPHSCEWAQHRLDVDPGRGPHHEDLSRREGRLARGRRQDADLSGASSIPRKSRALAPISARTNPG